MIRYNTEAQPFLYRTGTFSRAVRFQTVPRFYLDVLDGDQVLQDQEGIDFADRDTALAEAVRGARDLVASGIRQNEDVSGQTFIIRNNHGETVATVPFRGTLPGRLRGCPALHGLLRHPVSGHDPQEGDDD